MNLNKVFIVGRMTKDAEVRATPSGQHVVNFSLATNRKWTDKNGAKQEDSEYHNCVAWGKSADLIDQFVKKGSELLIEGRLQTRSWDDKKTGGKRYTTEIMVESMQFGAKPAQTPTTSEKHETELAPEETIPEEFSEENELPF